MSKCHSGVGLVVAFGLFVSVADAAEVRGRVTDAAGGALPGATVTLENLATGAASTLASDAEGAYAFADLGVGLYRVAASLPGFSQDARTLAIAASDETAEVGFVLRLGGLTSEVTVTATRSSRDTMVVPLRVESLTAAKLEYVNPVSTGDAMIQAPGVTPVANGPFQVRPRLRGLDSTRVLVLVDGERLNNARTATDRAGVEVGLVDASTIESIELVSGAGSVLYGTDALSGTVNIITAQPRTSDATRFTGAFDGYYSSNENGLRGALTLGVSDPRFALRVTGSLEDFDDYEAGKDFREDSNPLHADGTLHQVDTIDDNFGFSFGAFPEPFNEPYVRASRTIPLSSFKGSNVNAAGLYQLDSRQNLRVKYIRRRAEDVGFPDFEPPYFFQNIVLPYSNLDKVSARYQFQGINSWFSSLRVTGYWQQQKRKLSNVGIPVQFPAPTAGSFFPINVFRLVIDSSTEQKVDSIGLDAQASFLLAPRNVLTAGFTVYRDKSADTRESSTQFNLVGAVVLGSRGPAPVVFPELIPLGPPSVSNPTRVPDSSFRDFGVFAQDEWDLTSQLRLVLGARLDSYRVATQATPGYGVEDLIAGAAPPIDPTTLPDVNGETITRTAFTGDVGLVYRPEDRVSVVAHYGRSYRHPNLEELLFAGPATIGNIVPNVKVGPEKGNNFDVGVKLRTGRLNASLAAFWNAYDGFISTEIVSSGDVGFISQALNFADVRIRGIEGDLEAPFGVGSALVTLFGNFAFTNGQIQSGSNPFTGDNLSDTPQDNITPFKAITGVRVSDRRGRYWIEYANRIQPEIPDDRVACAIQCRVGGQLVSSPFLIAQDIFGLNGFTLHRIAGGVNWKTQGYNVGVTLAVENLTDKYYREQYQFAPARGRSFTVGLRLGKQ